MECPERLEVIVDALEKQGLMERCIKLPCDSEAPDSLLSLVHSPFYVQRLHTLRHASAERLEDENAQHDSVFFNEHSVRCALLAAGGVSQLASQVFANSLRNGICLVRPAGHHAGFAHASGFCLLNNVAIAARSLIEQGCKRVMVLDWDIHHGDGTQQAFLDDDRVLFLSLHRLQGTFPYNDSGCSSVVGKGKGQGYTVNIAWDTPGMGDAEYAYAWKKLVLPMLLVWQPQIVLVSAGFDAAAGDPLGDCNVSPASFALMTRWLMHATNGKVVLALEGGYNLQQLPVCATGCVRALLGDPASEEEQQLLLEAPPSKCSEAGCRAVSEAYHAHMPHWPSLARFPLEGDVPESGVEAEELFAELVTRAQVAALRDFSHLVPESFREGYTAWRTEFHRGAKGEPLSLAPRLTKGNSEGAADIWGMTPLGRAKVRGVSQTVLGSATNLTDLEVAASPSCAALAQLECS